MHKKLGFKPGFRVRLIDPPTDYASWLAAAEGVSFGQDVTEADAAHVFLRELQHPEVIARVARSALAALRPGGMLWLSWAKKSSPLHVGITEDTLRASILPINWVDVKVCAVDADWSALKFLRRKVR